MTTDKAAKCDWKYHGLTVFQLGKQEWIIGTRKQFRKAAIATAKEELWSFKADYLADFLERKNCFQAKWSMREWQNFINTLRQMQEKMCEDATPIIKAFLGSHLDEFVEGAIDTDGIGHFLNSYDGELHETKDIEGLNKGFGPLCVRIN